MAEDILILMCDAGGGHRSVCDAVVGALKHRFPGKYQPQVVDVVAEGFPWPLSLAGRMYVPVVNRCPRLWGLFWHFTNGRRRSRLILRLLSPLAVSRLRTILVSSRPRLIISTHPWGNHVPARLLQELGWQVPLITVVTDLVTIHRYWVCADADLCLVPTEEVREKALEEGLGPEKVKVVGIPVDPRFAAPSKAQGELREELGLAEEICTVLLVAGGGGMGNVFAIARAIAEASLDLQLLIVAGRNEKLKKRLEAVSWEVPTRVLGFAGNMADLMHVADLIITKAGPSTISEALACRLPILISGSLRGQEEGNAEWVVESGAGLLTPTPEQVVAALRELLQPQNDALWRMSQSARQAAKPLAALEAARLIDYLLRKAP